MNLPGRKGDHEYDANKEKAGKDAMLRDLKMASFLLSLSENRTRPRYSYWLVGLICAAVICVFVFCESGRTSKIVRRVAIVQPIEAHQIDEFKTGFLAGLRNADLFPDSNLIIYKCTLPLDPACAISLRSLINNQTVDLVVTLGTQCGIMIGTQLDDQSPPVICALTSDPIGSGLVSNMDKPGGNRTAVTDQISQYQMLGVITRYFPWVKTMGVVVDVNDARHSD